MRAPTDFPPSHPRSSPIRREAVFSPCRKYRYTLERYWGEGKVALFILLNPSTADAEHDDPTNRRGMAFARRFGCDGCVFLNLFAYRTPSPQNLKKTHYPIGPDNDDTITAWVRCRRPKVVVAAWGSHGTYMYRSGMVRSLLIRQGVEVQCLGRTQNHQPKHILYLKADTKLEPYLP